MDGGGRQRRCRGYSLRDRCMPIKLLLFAAGGVVINALGVWQLRGGTGANTRVVRRYFLEGVLG